MLGYDWHGRTSAGAEAPLLGDGSVWGQVVSGRARGQNRLPSGQDGLHRMISVQAKAKSHSTPIWLLTVPGQGKGKDAFEPSQLL